MLSTNLSHRERDNSSPNLNDSIELFFLLNEYKLFKRKCF